MGPASAPAGSPSTTATAISSGNEADRPYLMLVLQLKGGDQAQIMQKACKTG